MEFVDGVLQCVDVSAGDVVHLALMLELFLGDLISEGEDLDHSC